MQDLTLKPNALFLAAALLTGPVFGATDPASLCEQAALNAASTTGVPLDVLRTIALAESGRSDGGTQRPWPWTVNFGGQGFWYADRAEAELAVEERRALGATNIDIGCFQINHRWHGEAFAGTSAMFDPEENALYAAQFLARLFDETGNWPDAAAAFHSRTPEHADRYRARLAELSGALTDGPEQIVAPRINRFPLLMGGSAGSLGSLVPRVDGMSSLLGAAP
jgi:hypothetical protein